MRFILTSRRTTTSITLYNVCHTKEAMPPKIKKSASDIVDAALNVVRKKGWNHLNARAVAKELKTSTAPIYVQFGSMESLEEEVIKRIFTILESYQTEAQTGDPWTAGIGHVQFAIEEPNLFKAMNEGKALQSMITHRVEGFEKGLAAVSDLSDIKAFSTEQRRYAFYIYYLFILGTAYSNHMKTAGELSEPFLDKIRLDDFIHDAFHIIIEGYIKTRTTPKPED